MVETVFTLLWNAMAVVLVMVVTGGGLWLIGMLLSWAIERCLDGEDWL